MNMISKCALTFTGCKMFRLANGRPFSAISSVQLGNSFQGTQMFSRNLPVSQLALHPRYVQSESKSRNKKNNNFFNMSNSVKASIGLGLVFGGYLIALDQRNKSQEEERAAKAMKTDGLPYIDEKPPEQTLARSIQNPMDPSGLKLTLYQFQTCPFCCKVRAFLDYYGFAYDVVEVNSVSRKEVKWSSYKKVPFLIMEVQGSECGENKIIQLKDSSVIISILASSLRNSGETLHKLFESYPSYYDKDNGNKLEFANRYFIMYTEIKDLERKQKYIKQERKWRKWVDDKFVHTLSPNVYRTPSEALQAFNWFSQVGDWERLFATWERLLVIYVGAAAMWIIGKRLKSRHNITGDPRQSLYNQASLWMREVKATDGPFMGGLTPNLADLSMYGVLTAIEGCDAFGDLLDNSKIGKWYYDMKETVLNREGEDKLVKRCAIR